jgi:DNA-binding response OmpR family regulator
MAELASANTLAEPVTTTGERPTALVVNDDRAIVESLVRRLEYYGFCVLTAPDGVRALEAFRERSPSVVVIDIMKPELDGIGAVLQMRRDRPDVKIIALSGGGRENKSDFLTAAEELGADADLVKGRGNHGLVETLSKLLMAAA